MKHLILALLAATFSLSVTAASINLNSSRSNAIDTTTERGKPSKDQKTVDDNGALSDREKALLGADTCNFAIDQAGVKRQATEQQQKTCRTFNESRGNNARGAAPAGKPKSSEAGIAVSDPGVPNDKSTSKK
jgi:hypothetical protein